MNNERNESDTLSYDDVEDEPSNIIIDNNSENKKGKKCCKQKLY